MSFSTSCLSVRKDSSIVPFQDVFDNREGTLFVNLLLCGVLFENFGEGESSNCVVFGEHVGLFFVGFIERDETVLIVYGDEGFDF